MLMKLLSRYIEGYGLDGRCWIPVRDTRFLSIPSVQSGCGAHPVSYKMGTGGKAAVA
jgi:hypothetical protein